MDLRRMLMLLLVALCVSTTAVRAEAPADVMDVKYADPYRLFQLTILSGWIFQAGESDSGLLVFYGPEYEQLIYIEYFPDISFADPVEFAAMVLGHYGADYGLKAFQLVSGPELFDLAGVKAAQVEYNYLGRQERTECRVFVIVNQTGLTITLSEAREHYSYSKAQFDSILAGLSWEADK